ncbi:MAG: CBS domain-containing protein [Kofleriaceae bacterium]
MTRQPWTTASTISLTQAREQMHAHRVRHLPVVDDGKLVGLLSERDLSTFEAHGGWQIFRVRDAMSDPVYSVKATAALSDVARVMSEQKFGSAVVLSNAGVVEGIFTATDACRALAEILEREVDDR